MIFDAEEIEVHLLAHRVNTPRHWKRVLPLAERSGLELVAVPMPYFKEVCRGGAPQGTWAFRGRAFLSARSSCGRGVLHEICHRLIGRVNGRTDVDDENYGHDSVDEEPFVCDMQVAWLLANRSVAEAVSAAVDLGSAETPNSTIEETFEAAGVLWEKAGEPVDLNPRLVRRFAARWFLQSDSHPWSWLS